MRSPYHKWLLLMVLIAGLVPVSVPANQYPQLVAEQSYIKFSGVQNKKTEFRGQFESFTPYIQFDKANLAESSIRVEVDLASVESGSEKRDGMLKKSNWFDVKNTPQGIFASQNIVHEEGNHYRVEGTLTIKGISRTVTLLVKVEEVDGLISLSGNYTLNRLDYNLGLGAWKNPDWVKHEVDITYKVVLNQ